MIKPILQAQFASACDPDSVAFETAIEQDFPYHKPPPIISVTELTAVASAALVEFHDVWIRWGDQFNG
jgi:hypothetical protein